MKLLALVLPLILVGCSLDLEDVRAREAACKAQEGVVKRLMSDDNKVVGIKCIVDGVEYYVYPSGKLG